MNPSCPDIRRQNRPEPVPPETNRIEANIDAALEQQALDLAQRKPVPDIQHHRERYVFGETV
jgi:hypothetical protein